MKGLFTRDRRGEEAPEATYAYAMYPDAPKQPTADLTSSIFCLCSVAQVAILKEHLQAGGIFVLPSICYMYMYMYYD